MSAEIARCPCGCDPDMHIGDIGCPCGLPDEPPCATPTPLEFVEPDGTTTRTDEEH